MKPAIVLLFACAHAFSWPWEGLSSSAALSSTADSTGGFQWPWDGSSTAASSASSASASESTSDSSTSKTSASASASSSDGSAASPSASLLSSFSSGDGSFYVPKSTSCPSGGYTREAVNMSSSEMEYIQQRQNTTNAALVDFLSKRANLSDFDASSFIGDFAHEHNITIALAFSGGGYRAMVNGAGQLLATDGRFDDSNSKALGGLLQLALYIAGLSGGSWLVGSLVLNDWLSVGDIWSRKSGIWQLDDSIFNAGGINVFETAQYYYDIEAAVLAKNLSGYPITITDVWGSALSYQFYEDHVGSRNKTWSGVTEANSFQDHSMPYPILVANGRTPGTTIINENSTVFEMGPYEMGSWDPSLRTFAQTKYIGSNDSGCVTKFDNAGFLMGTSSSLFNQALVRVNQGNLNGVLKTVLSSILGRISGYAIDIAAYAPNPFEGAKDAGVKAIVNDQTLYLVDGGEDQQNVPFYPFIQNARGVDVVFGFDNSADTPDNWPNGTSLVHTYARQFVQQGKGTPFPYVPLEHDFLSEKLGDKPVFFGCNASELDGLLKWHDNDKINTTDVPLVVYISNTRQSYDSNTSTFKMAYDDEEKYAIIQNGFEVALRANLTDDSEWATCVGCAIIRRSQERLGQEQSEQCRKCFVDYCWSGGAAKAATVPSGFLSATASSSSESSTRTSSSTSGSSNTHSSKSKKGAGTMLVPGWMTFLMTMAGYLMV